MAVRYTDRPELWDQIIGLEVEVWPEYNSHGDVLNQYWRYLYDVFPNYQFVLYDDAARVVLAEAHTIPVSWSGRLEDLGAGIDASIAAGFDLQVSGCESNTLCALAAEIPPRHREHGLATVILEQMVVLARSAGLTSLIAPVRPNWKERYPLTPIERYVRWARIDGEPFDPWIRTHVRLGATIGPPIARSLRITGSVAEWETWTAMAFPVTGSYVFPAGLAPLTIDREADVGTYWEPNVWMVHQLSS